MYLIVGLGNPGKEYETTRHNAGFIAIDALAAKYGVTVKLAQMPHGAKHSSLSGPQLRGPCPKTLLFVQVLMLNTASSATSPMMQKYVMSWRLPVFLHSSKKQKIMKLSPLSKVPISKDGPMNLSSRILQNTAQTAHFRFSMTTM